MTKCVLAHDGAKLEELFADLQAQRLFGRHRGTPHEIDPPVAPILV